jgi:hypothetical protein
MSTWGLLIVSGIYLYTGLEEGWIKNWNWLGFWACYAGANLFYIRATANAVH